MKIDSRSLRLKIILNVFSTSVLVLLLFGTLIITQISSFTGHITNENLLEQARKIASYIEYNWRGRLELDLPKRYEEYYSDPKPTHQFAVLNSKGDFLFRSDNFMKGKIKNTTDKSGKHFFQFETEDGQNYAGLKYDYLFDDHIYPIYIMENEEAFSSFISTLERGFIRNLLAYGLPLLALQGLFIVFILQLSLRPVITASKDARNIKYNNLSFRLDEKHVPSEIEPLIHSVNEGLSRLEQSAEAQKFFIANAAHELRTPISILKARISSLQNEKEIFLLNQDLRDINRLISQMLDMSRLDVTDPLPMEEVDLNALARKACEDMGALFVEVEKDLSLQEKAHEQSIEGNEDTLFRALLNLLENALKHTPEKTPVKVIVDEGRIIVRDYGEPIPEEHRIRIFERFEKLPESVGSKGSGLGLAIVKKAVEIHSGVVSIVSRDNGNDFILDFR